MRARRWPGASEVERHAGAIYEAVKAVGLNYCGPGNPIDFRSDDGAHAVEVMRLTSETMCELSSIPPLEAPRLRSDWLIALAAPTHGAPRSGIPKLRKVAQDLVPLLTQCEDLGIDDPTRFRWTLSASGEYDQAEPERSIMTLLGRQRTISCRPVPATDGSGSVRLLPMWGGFAPSDPDDLAAALSGLIAIDPLKRHVGKVKLQDASHRVLILVPDSTWRPAWSLEAGDGFDRLPTLRLDTLDDMELWVVALDRSFVWIHDATGWHHSMSLAS